MAGTPEQLAHRVYLETDMPSVMKRRGDFYRLNLILLLIE